MKHFYALLLSFIIPLTGMTQDVAISSFASGFNKPISIKNAGDQRLFIIEQDGFIQILNNDGTVEPTPFLDIDDLVLDIGGIGDERGLLGLAFHPDYETNGFFYVNYIDNSQNTVISRFSRSTTDPNMADPNSEVPLLSYVQPFPNHNGGDMAFGPDGYLYISSGDGGSGGDPQDNGQSLDTFLGKILRIDVDGGSPYSIPATNPFFNDGDPNTLDEIWAYGLRNTWKFSFDSLTGDIWIADVGQGEFEEINLMETTNPDYNSGLNFGWRCYEGSSEFDLTNCPDMSTMEFPVGEYSHSNDGVFKCSVTGGYVYRGSDYPDFSGIYFFADYCSDEIGTLENVGGSWELNFSEIFDNNGWSAFGEDIDGELYIAGIQSGTIYKIVDGNLSVTDFDQDAFKMFPNPAQNSVTFDFAMSVPDELRFYDIHGQLISEITTFETQTFQVPLHQFAKGLYLVEVTTVSGNKVYKKLVTN